MDAAHAAPPQDLRVVLGRGRNSKQARQQELREAVICLLQVRPPLTLLPAAARALPRQGLRTVVSTARPVG